MTITVRSAVPQAERVVRDLELKITRRLDGLLQGDHRGLRPAPGSESGDGRAYKIGDDVRRIDWNLTARTHETQVRDTIADRELETWAVIDASASLDFGTANWRKRDLAIAVTAAFGFMSCLNGSRFGAIVSGPDGIQTFPATAGRDSVRRVLVALERRQDAPLGRSDLALALTRINRLGRRPGTVVLISDLLDPHEWVRPMRGLRATSHTVVAEIRDPREDALPAVGLLTLVDPETGRYREVQTANPNFRARFEAAACERRVTMRAASRSSGADHLTVSTDRDWLKDIVHFHASRKTQR